MSKWPHEDKRYSDTKLPDKPKKSVPKNPENRSTAPAESQSGEIHQSGQRESASLGSVISPLLLTETTNKDYLLTTTEKPPKIDFDLFLEHLGITLAEMLSEKRQSGMSNPSKAWTLTKARILYERFDNPCPADCSLIILKDWFQHTRAAN